MNLQVVQKDNKYYGKLPVIETQLTDTDNYFSQIDVNRVIKIGDIVQVNFRGYLNKNVPNNTNFLLSPFIAKISSEYTNILHLGGEYTVNTSVWFYLNGDGGLRGPSLTAGQWVHISIVYIAD